jgi:hypothetical protein
MMKEEALKLADELNGLNSCEPVIIKACETMIRRLVEELDKQGKPKAWIREDGVIAFFKQKEIDDQGFKWQPLYLAPQTKRLSDDEIVTIWGKANYESQYYEASDNFAIEYARAIEERHGIK